MIFRVAAMPFSGNGHRHCGGGPPPPLRDLENDLSEEQRQEFKAIFQNDSLTKQQMRTKIKEFFEKIGGDTLVKYNQAEEKMKAHIAERESKMKEKFWGLSDEAKKHLTKVKEIKNNLSLTRPQAREQIKKEFETLPENIKEEVKGVFPCHHHHRGSGEGHYHGHGHRGGNSEGQCKQHHHEDSKNKEK